MKSMDKIKSFEHQLLMFPHLNQFSQFFLLNSNRTIKHLVQQDQAGRNRTSVWNIKEIFFHVVMSVTLNFRNIAEYRANSVIKDLKTVAILWYLGPNMSEDLHRWPQKLREMFFHLACQDNCNTVPAA